jgi:hypothetical protein
VCVYVCVCVCVCALAYCLLVSMWGEGGAGSGRMTRMGWNVELKGWMTGYEQ